MSPPPARRREHGDWQEPAGTGPVLDLPAPLVSELHAQAGAGRWGVSPPRFAEALGRSCTHRFGDGAGLDAAAVETYLRSLNLADLALACACRDGNAPAWDHYMAVIQPRLRAAGRAMAGPSGEELADALVGDLYGVTARGDDRRSLFDYFHGRSRLTTWLGTVLTQRHVDAIRAARRTASLDAAADGPGAWPRDEGPRLRLAGSTVEAEAASAADRARVIGAFERQLALAVSRLPAADRLRLSYYYVHGLRLAAIGRLMQEHESSVSRKLDRARRELREAVERALREEDRLTDADLRQCYAEAPSRGALEIGSLLSFDAGEARSPQA
jgi:RNA polymerase sigma factor (sigma-70 family)